MATTNEIARLVVALRADIKDLNTGLAAGKNSVQKFGKETQSKVKELTTFVNQQMKVMAGYIVAGFGVNAIVNFAKTSIEAYRGQVVAERQLQSALGKTSKMLLDQAAAIQQTTTVADDQVIGLQAMLANYVKNEDAIKSLTPAVVDMASALGMDLNSAGLLVAKSISSSTNALGRYGIHITGAAGSTERMASVVQELNKRFGGMATALAQTDVGKIEQIKNLTNDVQESIGKELIPLTYKWNLVLFETVKFIAKMVEGFSLVAEEIMGVRNQTMAVDAVYEGSLKTLQDSLAAQRAIVETQRTVQAAQGRGELTVIQRDDAALTSALEKIPRYEAAIAKIRKARGANLLAGITEPTMPGRGAVGGEDTKKVAKIKEYTGAVELAQAQVAYSLSLLDKAMATSTAAVNAYYDGVAQKANESTAIEIDALAKRQAATKDAAEAADLDAKIQAKQIDLETKLVGIERERAVALKGVAENQVKADEMLAAVHLRAAQGMAAEDAAALAELQARQAKELEDYKKLEDDKMKIAQMVADQRAELSKFMAEQEIKSLQAQLSVYGTFASNVATIAQGLYEMTGKNNRGMFAFWKAASMAASTVQAIQAGVAAYASAMEAVPYPANLVAAPISAGLATAAGMVGVAKIAQTQMTMAKGGMLSGPSHAGGGVPVEAEGGEYFEPKGSVAHYGKSGLSFLEAFRQRALPQGFFDGFPSYSPHAGGGRMAEGGIAGPGAAGGSTIVNFVDPALFDRYLQTTAGKRSMINLIGQERYRINEVLR